jgi:hypothetical protein
MCCCCPPAVKALFCLWVQSGFSKGTVAGALTFFPPDPPLYKFERRDKEGNLIPDDDEEEDKKESKKEDKKEDKKKDDDDAGEPVDEAFRPKEGEHEEEMKSPAQQLTERSKELRKRAKLRNAGDKKDAGNGVEYKLVLDDRLKPPKFKGGGAIEAVKIPTKSGAYCAAIVYRCPKKVVNDKTKTIIFSHGNATDIGAMYPLQAILVNSLGVNVVSYDYSGYGESGGMPMEAHTYTDIAGVLKWTVENICDNDESKVILYGQSVGSGPSCYMGMKTDGLGGMVLHSPFMSGMRVLTPSR